MKDYGTKVFKDERKLRRLLKLAKTNKYSVPELTKIFQCGKSTVFGVFSKNRIHLTNLGRFIKKYKCDNNFFVKLTSASAYWAGFIAADGCLWSKNKKGKSLLIGLKRSDVKHLKKFKKEKKGVRSLFSEPLF